MTSMPIAICSRSTIHYLYATDLNIGDSDESHYGDHEQNNIRKEDEKAQTVKKKGFLDRFDNMMGRVVQPAQTRKR